MGPQPLPRQRNNRTGRSNNQYNMQIPLHCPRKDVIRQSLMGRMLATYRFRDPMDLPGSRGHPHKPVDRKILMRKFIKFASIKKRIKSDQVAAPGFDDSSSSEHCPVIGIPFEWKPNQRIIRLEKLNLLDELEYYTKDRYFVPYNRLNYLFDRALNTGRNYAEILNKKNLPLLDIKILSAGSKAALMCTKFEDTIKRAEMTIHSLKRTGLLNVNKGLLLQALLNRAEAHAHCGAIHLAYEGYLYIYEMSHSKIKIVAVELMIEWLKDVLREKLELEIKKLAQITKPVHVCDDKHIDEMNYFKGKYVECLKKDLSRVLDLTHVISSKMINYETSELQDYCTDYFIQNEQFMRLLNIFRELGLGQQTIDMQDYEKFQLETAIKKMIVDGYVCHAFITARTALEDKKNPLDWITSIKIQMMMILTRLLSKEYAEAILVAYDATVFCYQSITSNIAYSSILAPENALKTKALCRKFIAFIAETNTECNFLQNRFAASLSFLHLAIKWLAELIEEEENLQLLTLRIMRLYYIQSTIEVLQYSNYENGNNALGNAYLLTRYLQNPQRNILRMNILEQSIFLDCRLGAIPSAINKLKLATHLAILNSDCTRCNILQELLPFIQEIRLSPKNFKTPVNVYAYVFNSYAEIARKYLKLRIDKVEKQPHEPDLSKLKCETCSMRICAAAFIPIPQRLSDVMPAVEKNIQDYDNYEPGKAPRVVEQPLDHLVLERVNLLQLLSRQ
ncbi:hypothetical protein ACOME3_009182 [Neoechinorhynchus agilis]